MHADRRDGGSRQHVEEPKRDGWHHPVEQRERGEGEGQRGAELRQCADPAGRAGEAEIVRDLRAGLGRDLHDDRQPERRQDQQACPEHERPVEQLAPQVRTIGLASPDGPERRAHGSHHPARRPDEADQRDGTRHRGGSPGLLDRPLDARPDVAGQWNGADEPRDDALVRGRRQEQLQHRQEQGEEWDEREEDVVGDRRGALAAGALHVGGAGYLGRPEQSAGDRSGYGITGGRTRSA